MRSIALILILLTGCVANSRSPVAVETTPKVGGVVVDKSGSTNSGGAGWVVATVGLFVAGHVVHWRMARRTEKKRRAGL